ncbi:hypothetical protein E2C01_013467 [Portunus trituberculatus]|uniref:Uncharacterized protein n=1 Tax=Portunus trituberculatus TaxID=210409 RepID=A0A5B7DH64_PORTR|nr:hypothetical protein [Portunus trituberculatus]
MRSRLLLFVLVVVVVVLLVAVVEMVVVVLLHACLRLFLLNNGLKCVAGPHIAASHRVHLLVVPQLSRLIE